MPKTSTTGKGAAAAKKTTKQKRFTQKGIATGMKHRYGHLHGQYTGYHSAVVLQVAKRAISDRKSQFLTHLASALKVWFKSLGDRDPARDLRRSSPTRREQQRRHRGTDLQGGRR